MPALDKKRIASLSILLSLLVAAGLLARPFTAAIKSELQRRADIPAPIAATGSEQVAIMQAVIAAYQFRGSPPPPPLPGQEPVAKVKRDILLLDRSPILCPPPEPTSASRAECGDSIDVLSIGAADLDAQLPRKLRLELLLANKAAVALADPKLPGVRFARSSEVEQVLRDGFWDGFYSRYPDTAGMLRVSIAVVSEDRSKALIYFEHVCGGLCGTGDLYLLDRTQTGWRQAGSWMLRIS